MKTFQSLCIMIFCLLSLNAAGQFDPQAINARIRYAVLEDALTIRIEKPSLVNAAGIRYRLESGQWTFHASSIQPAKEQFHVFAKTFQPGQEDARDAYIAQWQARGYVPVIKEFGLQYRTASGQLRDNREYWISLARFNSSAEAQQLIETLKKESVWAWMKPERTTPGKASFTITGQEKRARDTLLAPITIETDGPVEVIDVDSSYWKTHKSIRLFQGPLQLLIGTRNTIEVYGDLPIETYLRGVLPAEMPASWPIEALKAQAIVARSEILASLAFKYKMEGFDFTALESCRAYLGLGGYTRATDTAVQATSGMALVHQGKYAKAVFSSCCGGWTENNETVWSGPANPLLRGIPDFPGGKVPEKPLTNLERWLSNPLPAWCAGDRSGFRWEKRFTVQELSNLVNKHYNVGTIQRMEEGPRGVSGRLQRVVVHGSKGKAVIERELSIRQVFGGLPSALVIIKPELENGSPVAFTFVGGGRGHGVGLCQQGARSMAAAGFTAEDIVKHYFSGAIIERMR